VTDQHELSEIIYTWCTRNNIPQCAVVSVTLNKHVFSSRLNSVSVRRKEVGQLFQSRGLATVKLRSPNWVGVLGTTQVSTLTEQRQPCVLDENVENRNVTTEYYW